MPTNVATWRHLAKPYARRPFNSASTSLLDASQLQPRLPASGLRRDNVDIPGIASGVGQLGTNGAGICRAGVPPHAYQLSMIQARSSTLYRDTTTIVSRQGSWKVA